MLVASFRFIAKLWGETKEKSLSQRMLIGPLILSSDGEQHEKGAFQDGSDWKPRRNLLPCKAEKPTRVSKELDWHLLLNAHEVFININNILSA